MYVRSLSDDLLNESGLAGPTIIKIKSSFSGNEYLMKMYTGKDAGKTYRMARCDERGVIERANTIEELKAKVINAVEADEIEKLGR